MEAAVGLLGSVLPSILGGKDKPPPVEKPKTAPVPDDAKMRANKEREAQRKYASQGRASTILSDESKLG